jgi:hypothetical protein
LKFLKLVLLQLISFVSILPSKVLEYAYRRQQLGTSKLDHHDKSRAPMEKLMAGYKSKNVQWSCEVGPETELFLTKLVGWGFGDIIGQVTVEASGKRLQRFLLAPFGD